MNRIFKYTCLSLCLTPLQALAEDVEGWFSRGYFGYSYLSDQDGQSSELTAAPSPADVELDGGIAAGISLGYRWSERFAAELAWEYRSHDSELTLDSGDRWDDGNYASNTIWINGFYYLPRSDRWQPYLGAGIGYIEEIDIDLDRAGESERSFSDDGDIAWQVFAGVDYRLTENWQLHGELRYSFLEDVDLSEESGSGEITGLDYDPLTFQVGVSYWF